MENEETKSKGKFPLALTLAIISVVGSIIVALITKWPPPPLLRTIVVDTLSVRPKPKAEDLSLCDKFKLAINDIPSNFSKFRGDLISEDEFDKTFQSNYVFDGNSSTVIFAKDERTYELSIESYSGPDSLNAREIFYKNIAIIDACLTTKFKLPPFHKIRTELRSDMQAPEYFLQEYKSDDFYIYVSWYLHPLPIGQLVVIRISRNK